MAILLPPQPSECQDKIVDNLGLQHTDLIHLHTTMELVNIFINLPSSLCCVYSVSFSKFKVYYIVLLAILTRLCMRSPEFSSFLGETGRTGVEEGSHFVAQHSLILMVILSLHPSQY